MTIGRHVPWRGKRYLSSDAAHTKSNAKLPAIKINFPKQFVSCARRRDLVLSFTVCCVCETDFV